jgi:hypothetical protein
MDCEGLTRRLVELHASLAVKVMLTEQVGGMRSSFGFEVENEIAALIDVDPSLPVMRVFGGAHIGVGGHQLANPVLDITARDGPAAAIRWLQKVISTEEADVRVVAEVWGAGVVGALSLPRGVNIAATSAAPPSVRIMELDPPGTALDFIRTLQEPTKAVAWVELSQMRWDEDMAGGRACWEAREAIHLAILAMALIPGQAPLIVRTWSEFVDSDLERAINGRAWQPAFEDGPPLDTLSQPNPIHESQLGPVIDVLKLPKHLANKLELPLSRLSLSRRRSQSGNQAIELCTALEALFGDSNEKTELGYRLRLRAALLLGRTLEERIAIRSELGKLYTLRSKAVHGTGSKPAVTALETLRQIQCGADIATRAILEIVQHKKWPDWAMLELDPPSLVQPELPDDAAAASLSTG